MFKKKSIETIIKEYKSGGILPDIWDKEAEQISNISRIAFLIILKKVVDTELKNLKKEEEENLSNKGLTTDLLIVSWVDPSKSNSLTDEGLEYIKANHPKWVEEKLKKGYFTWKLR